MSPQPARRRGRAFVLRLAASGLATAACATLLAQAPVWEFDLAITRLDRSDIRLQDFTRRGYRCARVARPEGARVPGHVAMLMARPKDLRVWPSVSDIEVIVGGTEMRRESFERDINRLAARGYEMCGFTIAEAVGRQPYGLVAVMERLEQRPPSGVSYRVLHTTGRSGEWERVQASAADGYALAYMVARPGAATDITHDNGSDLSGPARRLGRTLTGTPSGQPSPSTGGQSSVRSNIGQTPCASQRCPIREAARELAIRDPQEWSRDPPVTGDGWRPGTGRRRHATVGRARRRPGS